MIDRCSVCCLGIHGARGGMRFEALKPARQAVRKLFGGFREDIALGIKMGHDHGSKFLGDDFQRQIRILGLDFSPTFIRERNGAEFTHA